MDKRIIGNEIRNNRKLVKQLNENYARFKPAENIPTKSKVKFLPCLWYKCITFFRSLKFGL